MGLFKAMTKLAFAPVKAVSDVVKDATGQNGDDSLMLSLATLGVSSVVKSVVDSIDEAADDLDD